MKVEQIKTVKYVGRQKVRDIEVDSPLHRFYANGIVVSNSHALSYAKYSAVGLWLKAYYPLEFMCANLNVTERSDEKKGISLLDQRVKYCLSLGLKVTAPDVRTSGMRWEIHDGGLVAPLKNIRGVGTADVEKIIKNRPYASLNDFLERSSLGKSKVESLILAGALDCYTDGLNGREYIYNYYGEYWLKKPKKKDNRQMSLFDDLMETDEPLFEIKTQFSKSQLDSLFFEMNGFLIQENLLVKHAEYLKSHPDVKKISHALSGRTNKHYLLFCKIASATPFTSKNGSEFVKLVLSDGIDSIETIMKRMNYNAHSSSLRQGNVVVLPVQKAEPNGIYIDNLDKLNVKVIER